jgi:hypothetical protein
MRSYDMGRWPSGKALEEGGPGEREKLMTNTMQDS